MLFGTTRIRKHLETLTHILHDQEFKTSLKESLRIGLVNYVNIDQKNLRSNFLGVFCYLPGHVVVQSLAGAAQTKTDTQTQPTVQRQQKMALQKPPFKRPTIPSRKPQTPLPFSISLLEAVGSRRKTSPTLVTCLGTGGHHQEQSKRRSFSCGAMMLNRYFAQFLDTSSPSRARAGSFTFPVLNCGHQMPPL